jgi:hypothetical protein
MTGPACGSVCVSKSNHETGHDQSEITGHEIFEMTGHGLKTLGHDGLIYATGTATNLFPLSQRVYPTQCRRRVL